MVNVLSRVPSVLNLAIPLTSTELNVPNVVDMMLLPVLWMATAETGVGSVFLGSKARSSVPAVLGPGAHGFSNNIYGIEVNVNPGTTELVTCTVYESTSAAVGLLSVSEADVAPGIMVVLARYHW